VCPGTNFYESALGVSNLDRRSKTIEAINQLCQCEKNPCATKNRAVQRSSAATLQHMSVKARSAQGMRREAAANAKLRGKALAPGVAPH